MERLYPLTSTSRRYTVYRTIMADSASVCPMLQTNQELSRYIPVYVDIDTDADNPAGENLSLPLGAQHSGTNGLVHFPPRSWTPIRQPAEPTAGGVDVVRPHRQPVRAAHASLGAVQRAPAPGDAAAAGDTSAVTPEAFIVGAAQLRLLGPGNPLLGSVRHGAWRSDRRAPRFLA